jgi:D-sedoheptulose 7-phosphate isomerase
MSTIPHPENTTVARPVKVSGAEAYFRQVSDVLQKLPFVLIDQLTDTLWNAYRQNRAVYIFGNGGSAALASHCACDLAKGTIIDGNPRFRAFALTDNVPLLTAWANDARYEDIFAEQLRSLIQKGDVAFAISASGNSPNVLNALDLAQEMGGLTVGLTGFYGGKMKSCCELCVITPSQNMQIIEDTHLSVTHSIFTSLRERMVDASSQHRLAATANNRNF